jgi:hypothetical protein
LTENSTISPFRESVPICINLFLKSFRRVASVSFTMQVLLLWERSMYANMHLFWLL